MLSLIIIVIIVLGIIIGVKECDAVVGIVFSVVIGAIPLFILCNMVVEYPYNVDEKIKMYEEENIKIEEKVKETVRVYMDYEKDTYDNLVKDADLTTLIIKYPELGSNELIKSEIDLYVDNNKQIKNLKTKKIDASTYRWWLYFGK